MTYYDDLTIDEVLADPVIRLVMAADRVDVRRLEEELRSAADRLSGKAEDDGDSDEEPASGSSLSGCCQIPAPPRVKYLPFAAAPSRAVCGAPCAW